MSTGMGWSSAGVGEDYQVSTHYRCVVSASSAGENAGSKRGYPDASDYLISLVRADQVEHQRLGRILHDPANRARIEVLLDEALEGANEPLDINAVRRQARK